MGVSTLFCVVWGHVKVTSPSLSPFYPPFLKCCAGDHQLFHYKLKHGSLCGAQTLGRVRPFMFLKVIIIPLIPHTPARCAALQPDLRSKYIAIIVTRYHRNTSPLHCASPSHRTQHHFPFCQYKCICCPLASLPRSWAERIKLELDFATNFGGK